MFVRRESLPQSWTGRRDKSGRLAHLVPAAVLYYVFQHGQVQRLMKFDAALAFDDPFYPRRDRTDIADTHRDLVARAQPSDKIGELAPVFGQVANGDIEAHASALAVPAHGRNRVTLFPAKVQTGSFLGEGAGSNLHPSRYLSASGKRITALCLRMANGAAVSNAAIAARRCSNFYPSFAAVSVEKFASLRGVCPIGRASVSSCALVSMASSSKRSPVRRRFVSKLPTSLSKC